MSEPTLLELVGGRPVLERVHWRFYQKVFADPWLRQYFAHVTPAHQSAQLTDFMIGAMGGEKIFCGLTPRTAHSRMVISDELFDHRQSLLRSAIRAERVPAELEARWLQIDEAFRRQLVKRSRSECVLRAPGDVILDIPKPRA